MKKRIFYILLAAMTIGGLVAQQAHAEVGEACWTADGRSGYIFAGGRDGEEECRAE